MGNLLGAINSSTMLGGIIDWLDQTQHWLYDNVIGEFVGNTLWMFCDLFFIVLDLFELLFKKFAGIDTGVTGANGEAIEGDIVLYLIQSDLVQEIFFSILILSLFLLIIFTIFAIVKNQYAEKQEPVSKIINGAFKGLLMYLLVPVATIVCLMVGNVILVAIDGATSANSTGGASDMLFSAAAYNANRLRYGTHDQIADEFKDMCEDGSFVIMGLDVYIQNTYSLDITNSDDVAMFVESEQSTRAFAELAVIIDDVWTADNNEDDVWAGKSKWNFYTVNSYYHVFRMSFITILVGGAFLVGIIGKITWGLVSRLFKITFFYALSPAVMATFPLDNGKALGSWRGEMVKNGTMAFVSVGVTNVLYSFLPFFNKINLFGGEGLGTTASWVTNQILKLFIYIIAFNTAKDLIATIGGWFSTGDAVKEGAATKKMLSEPMKKYTTKAIGVAGAFKGGWNDAKGQEKNAFLGGLLSAGTQAIGGSDKLKPYMEAFSGGSKAGKESSKKRLTSKGFFREEDSAKVAEYEGREMIAAEKKKFDTQIAARTAERNRLLSNNQLTQQQRNNIESAYQEDIADLKAKASFANVIHEREQKEIDELEKRLEKRSSYLDKISDWKESLEEDNRLMESVLGALRSQGIRRTFDINEWQQIKTGNLSGLTGWSNVQLSQLRSEVKSMSDSIIQNERIKRKSINDLQQLAQSSARAANYITTSVGMSAAQIDVNTTLAAVSGNIDAAEINLANELRGLEARKARHRRDVIASYDSQTDQDAAVVGRSAKK